MKLQFRGVAAPLAAFCILLVTLPARSQLLTSTAEVGWGGFPSPHGGTNTTAGAVAPVVAERSDGFDRSQQDLGVFSGHAFADSAYGILKSEADATAITSTLFVFRRRRA